MGISKRGFIFTYDAMMAVALTLLFLNLLIVMSKPRTATFSALVLSRTANDLLASGEKSGIFATKDNDTIFDFMNHTLQPNINAELNMRLYNRSLDMVNEFNVSRVGGSPQTEYTVARRIVPIYESGNLTQISLVTIRMWRGDSIE